jgi:hypothetical protein
MGYEMFRAQREAATVLTPQQIDALAAVGQAKMNTGAMKGMGGMCGYGRVAGGRWQVAGGRWRAAGGGWRVAIDFGGGQDAE